jgi:hypothetical protein
MALVQIESPAFLVREEGFNPEALFIELTGVLVRSHVADQADGLFAVLPPPTDREHRAILPLREEYIRDADALAALGGIRQSPEMKWLALMVQCDAPGRSADVLPFPFIHDGLEIDSVKFPIAQEDHSSAVWNKGLNFLDQSDVKTLREVSLLSPAYYPSNGQSPLSVNQRHHERNTPSSHGASIHHQHQGQMGQTAKKRTSKRKKVDIRADSCILQPAPQLLLTAFGFSRSRRLSCNFWKLAAPTSNDATDKSRKGVEVPGEIAGRTGKCFPERLPDDEKPFLLSLMSGSIQCSFGNVHWHIWA